MSILIFYSARNNAFYPSKLHERYKQAGTWPTDAVELTEQECQSYYLKQPPEGKQLSATVNGRPAWVPIPPPDLDTLAAHKRAEIDAASVAALDRVRSDYPDYEQLSWERQEREAREGGGPLIQAIADARGLPLEELINRIIAKADAYQAAAGIVIGRRQALRDEIDNIEADESLTEADKHELIKSIVW